MSNRPEQLPSFSELLKQVREAPGGALGHLIEKIREATPDDATDEAGPEFDGLRRLHRAFIEHLKRNGLLLIVIVVAGIRLACARLKSRSDDLVAGLTASVVAFGNIMTTAIFVSAVVATAIIQIPTPDRPVAAFASRPREHNVGPVPSRIASSPAPSTSRYDIEPLRERITINPDARVTTSASASVRSTRDDTIVIDWTVQGWLPVTPFSSQQPITIHCSSPLGKVACAVLEPAIGLVPPPPVDVFSKARAP